MNMGITFDFMRKNRELSDYLRYTATEYRTFLLYTEPIVLKYILSEQCYKNVICLSIAMVILFSPDHSLLVPFVDHLLYYFVMSFQDIYGKQFVSQNVHGLLHICGDYYKYGPLDNCSAFIFENYMKILKSMVKKPERPLKQVINRYHEMNLSSKEVRLG